MAERRPWWIVALCCDEQGRQEGRQLKESSVGFSFSFFVFLKIQCEVSHFLLDCGLIPKEG